MFVICYIVCYTDVVCYIIVIYKLFVILLYVCRIHCSRTSKSCIVFLLNKKNAISRKLISFIIKTLSNCHFDFCSDVKITTSSSYISTTRHHAKTEHSKCKFPYFMKYLRIILKRTMKFIKHLFLRQMNLLRCAFSTKLAK